MKTQTPPSLWRRVLRVTIFGLFALVTIAAVAASWISFQGRRDWAQTKAHLLARGEKLSLVELAPPAIPDSQNFFADPIWRTVPPPSPAKDGDPGRTPFELLDTPLTPEESARLRPFATPGKPGSSASRTAVARDLLRHLGGQIDPKENRVGAQLALDLQAPLAPSLDRITQLLDRPAARSSLDYANPYAIGTEFYPGINIVSMALASRAEARLLLGQTSLAARHTIDLIRLAETLRLEPLLYAQMSRQGTLARATNVLTVGIDLRAWSAEDLLALQNALASVEILPGMALAFRGERGLFNQVLEGLRASGSPRSKPNFRGPFPEPALPLYRATLGAGDQADRNRRTQQLVEILDAAPARGFDENAAAAVLKPSQRIHPLTILSDTFFFLLGGTVHYAAEQQITLRQATLACALERYRLAHGEYPAELAALVPTWIPAIPRDVFTLQPMRYRRLSADSFRLWAAGRTPETDVTWTP